jgi:hypothetical protein
MACHSVTRLPPHTLSLSVPPLHPSTSTFTRAPSSLHHSSLSPPPSCPTARPPQHLHPPPGTQNLHHLFTSTPAAVMLLWPWLTPGGRRALRCVSTAMRTAVDGHVDSVTGDLDPPYASVFVADDELEGEDKTAGFPCKQVSVGGPPRQGRMLRRCVLGCSLVCLSACLPEGREGADAHTCATTCPQARPAVRSARPVAVGGAPEGPSNQVPVPRRPACAEVRAPRAEGADADARPGRGRQALCMPV